VLITLQEGLLPQLIQLGPYIYLILHNSYITKQIIISLKNLTKSTTNYNSYMSSRYWSGHGAKGLSSMSIELNGLNWTTTIQVLHNRRYYCKTLWMLLSGSDHNIIMHSYQETNSKPPGERKVAPGSSSFEQEFTLGKRRWESVGQSKGKSDLQTSPK
jgi:hypothetical protein